MSKRRTRNLEGMRFGRLVAVRKEYKRSGSWYYLFDCDCGNKKVARGTDVKFGSIVSCGCYKREVNSAVIKKHHEENRRTGLYMASNKDERRMYDIWRHMRIRCDDETSVNFKNYGAKGISYCKEWEHFPNFLSDMASTYEDGLTLDRIDNLKGYSPDNCRWATREVQQNNRSFNRRFEYKGSIYTLSQLSRLSGLNYHTLRCRLDSGWDLDKAVETPARKKVS